MNHSSDTIWNDGSGGCVGGRAGGEAHDSTVNDGHVLKTPYTRREIKESLNKSITHLTVRKSFSGSGSGSSITTDSIDSDGNSQLISYSEVESIVPISSRLESIVEMTFSCNHCGYEREKKYELYQHFSFDLMIDTCDVMMSDSCDSTYAFHKSPPTDDVVSLCELMNGFFRDEVRELKCESPDCSGSAMENKVTISTRLVSLPQIMVIHMKRFKYDLTSYSYKKVSTPVDFPIIFNLEHCGDHIRLENDKGNKRNNMQWDVDPREIVTDENIFQSFLEHMSGCVTDRDTIHCSSKGPTLESSGPTTPIDMTYKLRAIVRHIGKEAFAGHYICGTCHIT